MSPPNPTVAFSLWTDKMIILSLEDYNQGKPLPCSLLSDLNPYSYLPSNLPDGIGYLLSSDVKKDTQFGSWKANGEPSEIFINSVLTGWRTTFEFFEGRFPNEKKTEWVMQEYRITPKGQGDGSKAKDYGSLCRILQNKECIPDQGINMILLPRSNSTGGRGSKSEAQNIGDIEGVSLTSAERRDCALRGDFLELADLPDPQSPSSWIGYLLSSDVKKDTQFGSWKANGEPSEVFINSVLTGWRTTFEFFEGQFPNEKKTDWVMQEYIITPKGQGDGSKAKDYGSLCRILQNKECIPDQGINMIPLPRSNSTGGRGSKSEAQNIGDVEGVSLTSAERRDCALRDDFLELADLADPQSPFSTSFNSSCPTLASEEWFDSDMLLQEMEDKKIDQKEQFKYTVSGTVKPNGVVMRPAIVGKLTAEEPMKSNCSLPALVVRGEKDGLVRECKQEIEAVYTSEKASASSGHDRALNEKQKEKKGVPRQIKKLQKFFCL